MIELNNTKKENEYIPYPLRYKEQKQENGKLLLATAVFGSGYFLFLTIIGLKLGWSM